MTLARSRRMLLVAVGFSVAVAVFSATAAHAEQPPAGNTQIVGPATGILTDEAPQDPVFQGPFHLIPPGDPGDDPVLIDPPIDDILYPPDEPEPPQPPDPPVGPDDLANPTENPEPQPPGGGDGDQSIPTPERVDSGLGGADRSQGPAVPLVAFPLALAVLLLALVASRRRASTGSAR